MQAIADLQKQWRERERFRARHTHLSLESKSVVLGTDTVLAKRSDNGALETDEARAFTLLAVAYGRPVDRASSLSSSTLHFIQPRPRCKATTTHNTLSWAQASALTKTLALDRGTTMAQDGLLLSSPAARAPPSIFHRRS